MQNTSSSLIVFLKTQLLKMSNEV